VPAQLIAAVEGSGDVEAADPYRTKRAEPLDGGTNGESY
jgi:hypothetical protein